MMRHNAFLFEVVEKLIAPALMPADLFFYSGGIAWLCSEKNSTGSGLRLKRLFLRL
jgi:hypothetical protein